MIDALKLLMSHGLSGYLIIGVGVACLVISFERLYYLFIASAFDSTASLKQAKEAIMKRKYSQAIQICSQQSKNPELLVLKEGLVAVESGREAMRSALTGAVLDVSKKAEIRLSFLSLIASSATLLGLFGTIMGLMKTFEAIAGADATEKGRMLGLGISEAMHSTAAGVIVGVFAMAIHTICIAKSDSLSGKVQKVALDLMNWVESSERSQSGLGARQIG